MPQIYSGDEIGMSGGADPDNRHDFPGGFPGDARSAFTRTGRTVAEEDLFTWSSGMIKLRSAHPALQTGIEQNLFADEDLFAFVRSPDESGCTPDHAPNHATDRLLIVVNKSVQTKVVDLPVDESALTGCTVFQATDPAASTAAKISGGKLHFEEPAESISVFLVR
jgi:glycosidase